MTVGRGGCNQREIAVSAPVRFKRGMANLFTWWVKFKVVDRKKKKRGLQMQKKKAITSADVQFSAQNRMRSKKKVITSAGKAFQIASAGSLKCASGSLCDPRVSGSPSLI